jgi:hypothetical protein
MPDYTIHFQFNLEVFSLKDLRIIERIFEKYEIGFDGGMGPNWRDWFIDVDNGDKSYKSGALDIFVTQNAKIKRSKNGLKT